MKKSKEYLSIMERAAVGLTNGPYWCFAKHIDAKFTPYDVIVNFRAARKESFAILKGMLVIAVVAFIIAYSLAFFAKMMPLAITSAVVGCVTLFLEMHRFLNSHTSFGDDVSAPANTMPGMEEHFPAAFEKFRQAFPRCEDWDEMRGCVEDVGAFYLRTRLEVIMAAIWSASIHKLTGLGRNQEFSYLSQRFHEKYLGAIEIGVPMEVVEFHFPADWEWELPLAKMPEAIMERLGYLPNKKASVNPNAPTEEFGATNVPVQSGTS